MNDIQYKKFTAEEEKVYDNAIEELKENMGKGFSFDESCAALDLEDKDLKLIIEEDYLKILIADLHYSQRKSFEVIAKMLNVPLERISQSHQQMVEDVKKTAISAYKSASQQQGQG